MQTLHVQLENQSYPIYIERSLRQRYAGLIKEVAKGHKIALISDETVYGYYGASLKEALEHEGFEVVSICLKPGEESKTLTSVTNVYHELAAFHMTRSDLIVALGGGVIGDLSGFVAATYLRGIDFVQIPTSLLAQVDSSVGGKVAVDLPEGKNLVGSFYHPKMVLIDPDVLETLEQRFFNDGMGEVIKYACIQDKDLYQQLLDCNTPERLKEQMADIIYRCCDLKRQVVERDERDTGERMLLNFGHTLGHAIEKYYGYTGYTHGEGVAIGMYQMTCLSEAKKLTQKGTAEQIKVLLKQYHLPYEIDLTDIEVLFEGMKQDKKHTNGVLNLILLERMGKSKIYPTSLDFFRKEVFG